MKYREYLTEAKKTDDEIKDIIENEGLGYAIQSYLSWKHIENKELAKWWKEASVAMSKIESILGI